MEFPVTEEMLREMVRVIVREVDPERIVLFGSRIALDAHPESDLDLLVIEDGAFGPARSRRAEAVRIWSALRRFRVPKDILVFSSDEAQRLATVFGHVVYRAMREGRTLYERA
ncbi:MAG: nucleotidyltransferase domain-containing protein [Magnetococcales bacterium]|nr:nucleotidyltransferase domain-containing protein [Magnetococcales bacterium]